MTLLSEWVWIRKNTDYCKTARSAEKLSVNVLSAKEQRNWYRTSKKNPARYTAGRSCNRMRPGSGIKLSAFYFHKGKRVSSVGRLIKRQSGAVAAVIISVSALSAEDIKESVLRIGHTGKVVWIVGIAIF